MEDRSQVLNAYTERLAGIVSPAFREKTVLTVGVGAGSYAVEKLARFCPKRLKNCDFDKVELPNLARTAFTFADALAGRHKVDALAHRIAEVNPLVEVISYKKSITEMNPTELDDLFEGVDAVVAGTDHFPAQALINEIAVRKGIPAVFVGIHAGALGGRIVWVVPGVTPCYRCVARERYEAAERGEEDALNLAGAQGALVDCQFIDMTALKAVVAILERGQRSVMGQFYTRMGGRNDIIVRCDPAYPWGNAMWDALLSDLPNSPKDYARELKDQALFALDTIWLSSDFDPRCPVCGGGQNRHPQAGQSSPAAGAAPL